MTDSTIDTTESSLRIEKLISAAPEEVFDAWTRADSIKAWMRPGPGMHVPVAEVDCRVGGSFHIVMGNEDVRYDHRGTYSVVERPHHLEFTWSSPGTGGQDTVVRVDISEAPEGSKLVLTHTGFPSPESRDNHQGGWGAILEVLAGHLGG